MPNTTYLTLPYPALSNAPNVPQDMQNLAAGIDSKLGGVIICTSGTRPTARNGAVIYETNTGRLMVYNGGAWIGLFDTPLCVVYHSATQNVIDGGGVLAFNSEDIDSHGWHSTSTNNSRVTPNIAGWYEVTGLAHFTSNGSGRRAAAIKLSGGTNYYGVTFPANASNLGNNSAMATHTLYANGTTDYFELFAYQTSGGTLATVDPTGTRMTVKLLRYA